MTSKELNTYTTLKTVLKEHCDQFFTDEDMTTERLLWALASIKEKAPLYIALQVVTDTLIEWENVKRGIIPHW